MALLSADNPEEISFSWTGTTKGGGGGASPACRGVGGQDRHPGPHLHPHSAKVEY